MMRGVPSLICTKPSVPAGFGESDDMSVADGVVGDNDIARRFACAAA